MSFRVLVVCDRAQWAYEALARAVVARNRRDDLELDIFFLRGRERELQRIHRRYDAYWVLGWQLLGDLEPTGVRRRLRFLDSDRIITGIHSHHAWDGRATQPDRTVPPPAALIEFLSQFVGVNAVSTRLARLFGDAGLEHVALTKNAVDIEIFRPTAEIPSTGALRVGYSGTQKHDWRKGISELIVPACAIEGVELKLAMPIEGHHIALEDMHSFYNAIDLYVCASTSEGAPLPLLEAAACGRPLISTHVGCADELIEEGVNGFLIERDVEALRQRIALLRDDRQRLGQMGARSRATVEEDWSWEALADAWLDFVQLLPERVDPRPRRSRVGRIVDHLRGT